MILDHHLDSSIVMTPTQDSEAFPPGTRRLIDVDGNVVGKHASSGDSDIVLHPTPSDDPEDPLNWTLKRKLISTSCVLLYTLMIALPSGSVYSVVTPIMKSTGLALADLNLGTGVMFLCYGWACIIWQPLALQYGKRPAYLISMAASIAIMATAPLCTRRDTYLMNKCLQGIFGSPVESLCEISIADIWFAHERPKYLAWYGFSLAVTGKLAPMLAGFINYGQNWQWTLRWTAIWIAIAFVYCLFLMEETNYDRKLSHQPSEDVQQTSAVLASGGESTTPEKKTAPVISADAETSSDVEKGETIYPRKTYWQKLGVVDKKRPNRMLDILIAPFKGFSEFTKAADVS